MGGAVGPAGELEGSLDDHALARHGLLVDAEDPSGLQQLSQRFDGDGTCRGLFPHRPAFEHHRRYTKSTLRGVIEAAGWRPRRLSYMNFPGIAAWFMAGRVMKKTNIAVSEAKTYDRLVVPILSRVESMIEPPIGSNLVAIAQKS